MATGQRSLAELASRHGWQLPAAEVGAVDLDTALRLALHLARLDPPGDLQGWRQALYREGRRRLFPQRFPPPAPEVEEVARHFFPLADAVITSQAQQGGEGIAVRLPFRPLAEVELAGWPAADEYARLLAALERDGLLVTLAMAQQWLGFSIADHVLGVTGLAIHIGRQLARSIPVSLPLLHGAAIGHDVGKFGCVGDEERRIPRLHYYYTHQWYEARGLSGIGHIATNHSCWDLERVRLPVETQLLIYADFRVKDMPGPDGAPRMSLISLKDAFAAIRDKLENLDRAKLRRYEGVYGKLRDLEDYLLTLGVRLDPPGFEGPARERPRLPAGLDVLEVMAGRARPDPVALATGAEIPTVARLFSTAHNIGVMERLRNVQTMRGLLEEARSSEGWRDLRTYLGVLGEYSPAMSMEQKDLALEFCFELLSHRDDDIRYHASNRIGDLLALEERFWTKDLPDGVTVEESTWALRRLERVFSLLDRAPVEQEEDMGEVEKELYAIPVILRRLVRRAQPELRRQVLALALERVRGRMEDERPLVGLYACESLEVLLPYVDAGQHLELLEIAQAWAHHEAVNTRLMAWRVMLGVAREGRDGPGVREGVRYCVGLLAPNVRPDALVAELFLLEELARRADALHLAGRCRQWREEEGRAPVREVMLRNLKSRVGWVEKKINCDYLLARARERMARGEDPETHFANEVAFHLANILKVSRVEGARFHAGRCLLELTQELSVQQRNDLAVELLRSLQLDAEAVTRYIPRFLAAVIASLPEQEFIEILDDIEVDVRRGSEALQRLLLQTSGWLLLQVRREQLDRRTLRRLVGILMGALAEERASTVHEALAQVAMVLDRLLNKASADDRLTRLLTLATKQFLALVAHTPGDRGRFFLIASALNHLDHALHRARPRPRFPPRPSVALMPGTFDPFTVGHAEVAAQALKFVDEVLVQVDDYSWRKHAQPRRIRQELAWRALAPLPEAFLSPIEPPINIASRASLASLPRRLRGRPFRLVVGSDVLEGASAYRSAGSAVWDIPHIVIHRQDMTSTAWRARLPLFRAGVEVATVPPRVSAVSSTSVRQALRRREALEAMCDPLLARILSERQLYLNFPSAKETVNMPRLRLVVSPGDRLPPELGHLARLDTLSAGGRRSRGRSETLLLCEGESGRPLAALSWIEVPAAELPVAVNDRRLTPHLDGRLLGRGALVTAVAADRPLAECTPVTPLLAKAMARWMDGGLLFALFGLSGEDAGALEGCLVQAGASWLAEERGDEGGALRWAAVSLTDPLLLLWDMGFVLQPHYGEAPSVRQVIEENRRAIASFFGSRHPGTALLQVQEREVKREVAAWARERLAGEGSGWVVLGLGTFFVRDLVGEYPTIALELERFLTWEGYEAGTHPAPGSPPLELQLHTARSLGRDALLLAPILIEVEPLLAVAEAARAAGVRLREVLVGLTSASVHATLHLKGIRHRCGTIVPRWRGVLRESAVAPFIGGWNILGRAHMQTGSLLPSLNDCLPYHDPHPLGLDREGALDFSRLALELTRRLLEAIEERFRATEGRFLSLPEMGAVVRIPRCPPMPEGFEPPRDRLPSHLLAEDLRALARLHPETHEAHRTRWSGR